LYNFLGAAGLLVVDALAAGAPATTLSLPLFVGWAVPGPAGELIAFTRLLSRLRGKGGKGEVEGGGWEGRLPPH